MPPSAHIIVERITPSTATPSAIAELFEINCAAFGTQTSDGIWSSIFPGWDTPAGKAQAVARLTQRLQSTGQDPRTGDAWVVFLKASVPAASAAPGAAPSASPGVDGGNGGDGANDSRVAAGFAIWAQESAVPDFGAPHPEHEISDEELALLHPGNEPEQRYLRQVLRSLHARRREVMKEKADAYFLQQQQQQTQQVHQQEQGHLQEQEQDGEVVEPPAVFVLDSCAVHPSFQRMGVATALVRWGLEEAQRRGGLECVTEGSRMGRHVYLREGFWAEGLGEDMGFEVDEEFRGRDRPPNVFLRTGKGGSTAAGTERVVTSTSKA